MAVGKDGELHLRDSHHYYAQVQGEMALLNVEWCDFVVFSGRAVAVERILFNLDYWQEWLLPKLQSFYRHHIAKEILSREYFFEMLRP